MEAGPGQEATADGSGGAARPTALPGFADLPSGTRRRLVLRAVLRAALTVTVLVVLYYELPMDRAFDSNTIAVLVVGLLVFMVVVTWQVRAILRADLPAVKAVEALSAAVPLFLLVFATTYFLMYRDDRGTFTQALTRTDALYFTVTVFATVGFGDISAVTQTARIVVTVQMLADLLVLGLLIRLILSAVQTGQQRRAAPPASPDQAATATADPLMQGKQEQ
jgi:voltage-gated potassium channel